MEMPVPALIRRLAPQTACAFRLRAGDALAIVDVEGAQVADVVIFSGENKHEYFSPGRTLDYNARILLSTGATLYSNRSNPLMTIEDDDVGVHDYLLTPCSERMFEILHGMRSHPSCHGNLAEALSPFGVTPDDIHATFNAFMRVNIDTAGGISVGVPPSRAGDRIVLRAMTDLLIGLTACSSEHSNGGRCKPIAYDIL